MYRCYSNSLLLSFIKKPLPLYYVKCRSSHVAAATFHGLHDGYEIQCLTNAATHMNMNSTLFSFFSQNL